MENKIKLPYEEPSVDILALGFADILTTSGGSWNSSDTDADGWT